MDAPPAPTDAPPAPAPSPSRRELRQERERARARAHWYRRRAPWLVAAVVLVVVVVLAAVAATRLSAAPAVATVRVHPTPDHHVAGSPPTLTWPATGQAALSIPALGVEEQSGTETPVPIASMTKVMTAYLVLRDHPLTAGQDGPVLTMTSADVTDYDDDVGEDGSSVQVTAGERLTERQLLEGMLVHSANNFADALARWDAGSTAAFVAKMNATAASLGMHSTHYVDTSGYDSGSQSTASDQLLLGARAMRLPAFAKIVDMSSVTLPVVGNVTSYTPLTGTGDVIGVKSGFTDAAGGCDMLASVQRVGGTTVSGRVVGQRSVLVLAVITGQEMYNVLPTTGGEALWVSAAAAAAVQTVHVMEAGEPVASVSANQHTVPATTTRSVSVLAWPGQTVRVEQGPVRRLEAGARQGALVTEESVRLGTQREVVPVRLSRHLPSESLVQRLF